MHLFAKKMQKNLLISKKSSTFAPAFDRRAHFALRRKSVSRKGTPPGAIAQLVEQRTENPCVPSSILGGTTERDFRVSFLFFIRKYLRKICIYAKLFVPLQPI